jgi:PhzF family phenazine biosynthesis protein
METTNHVIHLAEKRKAGVNPRRVIQEGIKMKTYIVDSLTDQAFKGNPAGVCLADDPLSDSLMQSIAFELNFSETAFVVAHDQPDQFSIRYFSPQGEIPLCGHATLASSKVLFRNQPDRTKIRFFTGRNVELQIAQRANRIVMEFPVYGLQPQLVPEQMLAPIGVNEAKHCFYNHETEIILLEIDSAETLRDLRPDFDALVSSYKGIHGLLVTAKASDAFDFHSRFFWPWAGGTEDPVTGGTHTFLAKYWADRLGKRRLRSFQSSERTGSMDVELTDRGTVLIEADAVVLFEGNWLAV